MEHRSYAPDIVVPNDDYAGGNKRAGELAPDVAPGELRQEKQVGGPLNCSDSELCTFLLALEAGFLPTYYSDTSQSVQLKSMSIASRSYQHGKKTVVFHGFPSLQMSSNLTESHGEAVLMSFLAAFPAKTYQQQGEVLELMESDPDCGQKWHGSFAKYDHDLSLWKTAQHSLLGDYAGFSETWPASGTMRNGECWERTILEPITAESEFGSSRETVPTPVASMCKGSSQNALTRKDGSSRIRDRLDHYIFHQTGGKLNPTWVEWLMGWPLGWTDLKPLEMAKFRQWLQSHLNSCWRD